MITTSPSDKLGISFHRSLPCRRAGILQLLNAAENTEVELDYARIWERTSLGTVDAQATSRYAFGFGLYNKQGLTPLATFVRAHDPGLTDPATQWLLHYQFSAPHDGGPAFWTHLVKTVFQPGDILTSEIIAKYIEQYDLEHGGKQLKAKTYRGGAVAFLNTYGKWDGLGALGLLKETQPNSGEYIVDEPTPVPWPVVAYALADTWAGQWGDRVSVNLDQTREVGALLLMGSGSLNTRLRAMQERGMIEVQRRIPPYQVTRLSLDPAAVLEHLYERDDDTE